MTSNPKSPGAAPLKSPAAPLEPATDHSRDRQRPVPFPMPKPQPTRRADGNTLHHAAGIHRPAHRGQCDLHLTNPEDSLDPRPGTPVTVWRYSPELLAMAKLRGAVSTVGPHHRNLHDHRDPDGSPVGQGPAHHQAGGPGLPGPRRLVRAGPGTQADPGAGRVHAPDRPALRRTSPDSEQIAQGTRPRTAGVRET